jgi:hypothetical protein
MGGSQRSCVQCGRELGQDTRFCATCGHAAALNSPHTGLTGEEEAATRALDAAATGPGPAWDGATYPPPSGPGYSPPAGPAYPPPAAPAYPPPTGPAYPPPAGPAYPPPAGFGQPPPGPARPGPSGPSGPSATDTAQFPANWLDNVGFKPEWEQAPPPPGYDDPTRPPPARRDSRRLFVLGLFALLAAVIIVPALLVLNSLHAIGGSPAAAHPVAKQPASGAAASPARQRAAATGLAALLARSVADRDAIVNADVDASHCGPALSGDPQTLRSGARARQVLLRRLASLPGRSALPAGMIQALSSAWRASITVDQDLARWAQDEVTQGCKHGNPRDPNLQASNGPDQQATAGKTAFVSMWNPIAAKYGLTSYQTSQL